VTGSGHKYVTEMKNGKYVTEMKRIIN